LVDDAYQRKDGVYVIPIGCLKDYRWKMNAAVAYVEQLLHTIIKEK